MSKNRKRFAAVLLSAHMTAFAVPAVNILADGTDPVPNDVAISALGEGSDKKDNPTMAATPETGKPAETPTPPADPAPSVPSADPGQTTEPETPKDPEPVTPAEPEPEVPADPEKPDEKPSVPEVKPSAPETPVMPSVPGTPQAPAAPAQPEKKVEKPQPDVVQPAIAYKTVKAENLTVSIADKGYKGSLKKAIKLDDFKTANLTEFLGNGNPFMVGQCTWFAWARFYQVYGFDSGARGNGKTNAREIVAAHADKFELSSTPSAGATFSMEKNTLYPQYGHVGFIESFDGEYIWVSEGNVMFNGSEGNIWIHKVRWADFKAAYPDVIFAIPKKGVCDLEEPHEPAQRVIRLKTRKVEKEESKTASKTPRRIVLKRPSQTAE